MEIICAGYWKTGTKSCSAALRELGYNVADIFDTGEHLSQIWKAFIEEKCDISEVIAEYQKHNFHANQDYPGNFMWEDLYNASPNAKVILTVRDSDEQFVNSWNKFIRQECENFGNPGMYLFRKFQDMQFGGKKDVDFTSIDGYCMKTYFMPGLDPAKRFFLVENFLDYMESFNRVMRQSYNRHIAYVKATVPADRLLVWNIKEGWAPLCKFLEKPIPDKPIPHDNKTGDTKFVQNHFLESDYGKGIVSNMKKNVALWILKFVGVITFVTLEYRSGWQHSKQLANYVHQTASNYI